MITLFYYLFSYLKDRYINKDEIRTQAILKVIPKELKRINDSLKLLEEGYLKLNISIGSDSIIIDEKQAYPLSSYENYYEVLLKTKAYLTIYQELYGPQTQTA